MTLDPKSELARDADSIRDTARQCRTVRDLADKRRWSMETARHANAGLNLNLPEAKLRPPGQPTPGQACPKQGKAKPGGGK